MNWDGSVDMKKLLFGLVGSVLFASLADAETGAATTYGINASATTKVSLVRVNAGDEGNYYYRTMTSARVVITAVLPLSTNTVINDPGDLVFSGNYFSYAPNEWIGDVVVTGSVASKRLTYKYYDYDLEGSGNQTLVGIINLSWNASSLKVNGTFGEDILNSLEWVKTFGSGTFYVNGEADVTIGLGNQTTTRHIGLYGEDTATSTMRNDVVFTLHDLSVSGQADVTSPTLTIQSPAKTVVVTNSDTVTLTGTATDASGIYSMSAEVYSTALDLHSYPSVSSTSAFSEYATWKLDVTPFGGTNIVTIYAADWNGNGTSLQRFIICKQNGVLTLITNGSGSIVVAGAGKGSVRVGESYKVTLTPAKGYILADWASYILNEENNNRYCFFRYGWSNSFFLTIKDTNFALAATFIKNPFASFKGSYTAATHDDSVYDGAARTTNYLLNATNTGLFTLTVTTNGVASAKHISRAGTTSLSGSFARYTLYSLPPVIAEMWGIDRRTQDNDYYLQCDTVDHQYIFKLNATNLDSLTGYYYAWPGLKHHSGFIDGYRNRTAAPNAGTYNIALLDDLSMGSTEPASTSMMGYGYATAKVANNGTVTATLYPADGISAATTVTVSQGVDGSFFLYSPLYAKGGFFSGRLAIVDGAVTNYVSRDDGSVSPARFVKPASTGKFYPDGFTNALYASGYLYTAPKAGTNVITWSSGSFGAWDSDSMLATADLDFARNAFIVTPNEFKVSLSLKPATGVITGTFVPENGRKATFNGLLIGSENAVGFFKESTTTGGVSVTPGYGSHGGAAR